MRRYRLVPVMLLLAAGAARAEPRFAVREGLQCGDCHVNRTGGGMRTPFGASFAQTNLAMFREPGVFDPRLGESFSVGANVRLVDRTLLAAVTHKDGTRRSTKTQNTFAVTEGNLYLRADAIPDRVILYIDETVAPEGASSREAFVMVKGLPIDGYVKAGRILLPYGLRLPDNSTFIRRETGFTYANQDLGVEVGVTHGRASAALAVSNGSDGAADPNKAKQLTLTLERAWDSLRAGASFSWNDTSQDDFTFQTFTSGAHLGARLGRLLWLGELDWIRGVGDATTTDQFALYSELDFEALKGLYARFVFEAYDPLRDQENNERDRFVMGLSWFPVQLFEMRAEYRLNRDIPQRVEANADEILIELHGFL